MPRRKSDADAGEKYAKRKASENARQRKASEGSRDIGPLPRVKSPARRKRCSESLRLFCETYFPRKFFFGWSADHLAVIDRLERCVCGGGLFAVAMPRGSGKSELAKRAVEWAVLTGRRKFVMLVAATDGEAENLMNDVKESLQSNDLLAADFPEACHPVRSLENITHRAKGQLLDGRPTRLAWKADEIRLATVPRKACSGATIRTRGITGSIRGASAVGAEGETLRPDLVILDDPQTRGSAGSLTQTADRERIIRGDVLGLAGPDRTIACVATMTVIYPGDLADRFLDAERCPQWQPIRTRMVLSFPTAVEPWERYFEVRADSLRAGGGGIEATEYYRLNRESMDAGAVVSWPERYDRAKYLSAVEEAMVKQRENPGEFAAEYQNDPLPAGPAGTTRELIAAEVAGRVNRVVRLSVPRDATRTTAFIDVGGSVLYYAVAAWDEKFNGGLIDYGTWPRQNRAYFTARDAAPALADLYAGFSEPQLVFAGLKDLTADILDRAYTRQDVGDPVRVGLCLIDAGWQTDAVHQFCRQSRHAAILLPSQGYATTSNTRAMDDWQTRPGEVKGTSWRKSAPAAGRGTQLLFDPDHWKSFVADRLTTPPGGMGCLQLFGDNPTVHQLFAEHCAAEFACRVQARGREYDKWQMRPDHRDNHWFDAVVGTAVAASVQGLNWVAGAAVGDVPGPRPPRKKVKLSDEFYKRNPEYRPGGRRLNR